MPHMGRRVGRRCQPRTNGGSTRGYCTVKREIRGADARVRRVWGRPGGRGWFRSAPNYGATTSFKQSSSITKTTQQAHGIEREGDTGCTNGATGGSWRGRWAFELGDTRALREERQSGEESECCARVLEVQRSVDTVRAAAASQCARHAPCSRAQTGQLVRGAARSCGETLFQQPVSSNP